MKNPKVVKCNSVEELHDEEMQFLQEQISFLAEDVMELDENQDELYENMNHLVDILDKASDVAQNVTEILAIHQERIRKLEKDTDTQDICLFWVSIIVLIWNIVLTLNAFNVF